MSKRNVAKIGDICDKILLITYTNVHVGSKPTDLKI
jgi:hypothetical protein